jgi:hypothetical protein
MFVVMVCNVCIDKSCTRYRYRDFEFFELLDVSEVFDSHIVPCITHQSSASEVFSPGRFPQTHTCLCFFTVQRISSVVTAAYSNV